ncbi:MAG: hypothetical protein Kow0069_05950 [Promethearchaeota archaeon]
MVIIYKEVFNVSASANYAIMFQVLEGGVSQPVNWSKEHLKPDNIVIVIDEENGVLWLWQGAANGLVKRRTSLRQAESLKGHGYTVGKSIVGRGITKIIEIDARKVGRVPEMTELNEKFMKLLDQPYREVGDHIVVFTSAEAAAPAPATAAKPKPKLEAPKVEAKPAAVETAPGSPAPAAASTAKPKLEPPKVKPAAKPKLEAPKVEVKPPAAAPAAQPVPSPAQIPPALKTELLKGAVIMAVLSEYSDVYVSKKADGKFSVESLESEICTFRVEGDEVAFEEGSFGNVPPIKVDGIKAAVEMLTSALK